MAGNPSFNRLTSVTLQKIIPKMEDNIFTSTPWLYALTNFGEVVTLPGGTVIQQPLMYAENKNHGSYSGADPFLMDEDEGTTAAVFDWKQYGGTVRLKNIEIAKNSGPQAILRIVENEVKRLELSISESLDEMFITSNGTGNASKDWNGLANLVSDTVVLGGIDPAAAGNDWWKSTVTTGVGALSSFAPIRDAYLTVSEGNDFISTILTTQALYAKIDILFEQRQRFMDPAMANQGFETIKFHNAPIFFDRNVPTGFIYGLNLKYFTLYKLGPNWFKFSDWMEPINQDLIVKKVKLYGNLTISNRKRQFLLTGVT